MTTITQTPYAWTMTGKLKWQLTYDAGTAETWRELNAKVIPLFTHADPVEVAQLRQRVKELESKEQGLEIAIGNLEAQLAAQPKQDPIGDMKWIAHCKFDDGEKIYTSDGVQTTPEAVVKAALKAAANFTESYDGEEYDLPMHIRNLWVDDGSNAIIQAAKEMK